MNYDPTPDPSRMQELRELWVVPLGRMSFDEALELQRSVARSRISGEIPQDVLLLVEHPPVVTLGRSSKDQHLMASPELLAARGVELREVERGGDVTFHGPGQLVGYPVVDLKRHRKDLHWYLRQVEEAIIRALVPLGLECERNPGYTGVWIDGRKLASIGVHARDWVTWHGFALNVTTDLSYFELIVPCGIAGVTMTSVARELGARGLAGAFGAPDFEGPDSAAALEAAVGHGMARAFAGVFRLGVRRVELARLRAPEPSAVSADPVILG